MRIAWFTPVTGDGRTVEYSRWVLAAMAEICEPRLCCIGPPERFATTVPVVDLGARPEALWDIGPLDAAFYILGNDLAQHAWTFEMARSHPGIVVLHNRSLHPFFLDYYVRHLGRPDLYITRMAEHYGLAGLTAAHRILGPSFNAAKARTPDEDRFRYTFTEEALRSATAAVVHSRSHAEHVRQVWNGPVYETRLPADDETSFDSGGSALAYARSLVEFAELHSFDAASDYFERSASRAVAEQIATEIGQTLGRLGAKSDSPGVDQVITQTARLLSPPPA